MAEVGIKMEVDNETLEVSGKICHFNKGAAFFQFQHDRQDQICLFRPNKIFIDGQKMGASVFKSIDTINKIMAVGDEVSAVVVLSSVTKPYIVTGTDNQSYEINPRWYANMIWKGQRPKDGPTHANATSRSGTDPSSFKKNDATEASEDFLDNTPGTIIYNRMYTGQSGPTFGFISFKSPRGGMDIAQFRSPKLIYINGERADPSQLKEWQRDQEIQCQFQAFYQPTMKEFIHKDKKGTSGDERMEEETKFKPNWRVKLVWIGEKPSNETLEADGKEGKGEFSKKTKKKNTEFIEAIKDCEYVCGRLEKILSNEQGILINKDRAILFNIKDLSVDGQLLTENDNLYTHLQIGENLFSYVKSIPARRISGHDVSYEAAQIWKGKRKNLGISDQPGLEEVKKERKNPIPLPKEATHTNIKGKIVEIEGPGLGKMQVISTEKEIHGNRALFSRNRLYIDGQKLKFKDSIAHYVNVGETLLFDMVRADPHESGGEYQWMAVLTWKGLKPDIEEINAEISKKVENYRAKILKFDDRDDDKGYCSGVLQVMGGPNKIGERAIFFRDSVYVFGARMKNADLLYVLKENDKVQLELQELDIPIEKYGVEIKYQASQVWVGPPPKLDENCDDFPHYVGPVVIPFLTKRGMDNDMFTRLIKGQLGPKTVSSESESKSGATLSTILPPNTIVGKVIELKKPEIGSASTGTEHGILQIESGPFAMERAFFNRNSLFCWGHNCAKADLMYLINDSDKFCIEIQDGTNNKSVPYKVTSAWIGPHPHEKNKESAAMAGNPHFMKWLQEHNLTIDIFMECVGGAAKPKPFFPIAGEQQNAKVLYLLPGQSNKKGGGADAGILKVAQGSLQHKTVLFERESVYLWNVQIKNGDLNFFMKEGDKLFVEATELIGKDKKKWQTKLGNATVPKYIASIVFIGGGRPKPERSHDDFTKNSNLVQWLNKRNINIQHFAEILEGKVLPQELQEKSDEDVYSQAYPTGTNRGAGGMSRDSTPFSNPALEAVNGSGVGRGGGGHRGARGGAWGSAAPPASMMNPIMRQAEELTHKVMALQSPDDPEVCGVIQDDSEAQLALFISKTLTNAIMMYRQGRGLGAIGTPVKPGPIGPPRGRGGLRGRGDFSEFYADSGMSRAGQGRGGGLYGLSEPLLQYNNQRGHSQGYGHSNSLEPPYKRKFEEW